MQQVAHSISKYKDFFAYFLPNHHWSHVPRHLQQDTCKPTPPNCFYRCVPGRICRKAPGLRGVLSQACHGPTLFYHKPIRRIDESLQSVPYCSVFIIIATFTTRIFIFSTWILVSTILEALLCKVVLIYPAYFKLLGSNWKVMICRKLTRFWSIYWSSLQGSSAEYMLE